MRRSVSLLSIFILGFLCGLAFMNFFQMHTLDRLYRIQNQLTNQLLDQEIKLEKLNQSIKTQKNTIVKDLKIHIEFDGNPLIQDEIEKNIRFFLSDLVGRELSLIDGEMIYKILDKRIIEVEDKEVRLYLKYIIINERISVSVKALVTTS